MRLLNCLNQDLLLEFVSIPEEISILRKTFIRTHIMTCDSCQEKSAAIRKNWDSYFKPETNITSSLLKVYSQLQTDETLILKGWKLGEQRRRHAQASFLSSGWVFRGGVSLGLAAILVFVIISQINTGKSESRSALFANNNPLPLAQIRVEEKNTVKVHFLEPELLQTVEFETTRGTR